MKTAHMYLFGLGSSVVLTLAAFIVVSQHVSSGHEFPSHQFAVPLLIMFALVQFCIQLYCFLHVGQKHESKWNIAALSFALFVVVILVGGTLWIMHNLSHMQSVPSIETIYIDGEITPQTQDD